MAKASKMRGRSGAGAGAYVDTPSGLPEWRTLEQLSEERFAASLRADERLRLCLNCTSAGVLYREIENVGRLQCRFHPGALRNGRYACCAYAPGNPADVRSLGCTRCDHTLPLGEDDRREGEPRWSDATMTQRLPLHLLHLYAPRDDLVVERRDTGDLKAYALVLRVDPRYLDWLLAE